MHDPNQDNQLDPCWNRKIMQIEEAIKLAGTEGQGINVAILDTGVDYNHPGIKDRFDPQKKGHNFVLSQDPDEPIDDDVHGTLVARILAEKGSGVAPQVNLYAIKLSRTREFPLRNIMEGLDWCVENSMDIVNMSLATHMYDRDFHKKCEKAYKKKIVLVAAAGNIETGADFPASFYEEVISVASIDSDMRHCVFSNVWPSIDVSAPGKDFYPLNEMPTSDDKEGTSYSAPQITGVIAIGLSMLRKNGKITSPKEIEQVLKETAMDLSDVEAVQKVISDWIEVYDPHRKLFKKDCFDGDATLIQCMYGAGLVQAEKFIRRLKVIKGID